MTAALASFVGDLDLAPQPGVSPRAVRAVLAMMAKIANDSGEFRYGLRGSKLAALTDYSLSVVRRAQRYLVDHGYLERVRVGGGRASTRWRIVVHKLRGTLDRRTGSQDTPTRQPGPDDTAQGRTPRSSFWMHRAANRRRASPVPPPPNLAKTPALCKHGSEAGFLPSGLPRCPSCRRQVLRR